MIDGPEAPPFPLTFYLCPHGGEVAYFEAKFEKVFF